MILDLHKSRQFQLVSLASGGARGTLFLRINISVSINSNLFSSNPPAAEETPSAF